MKKNILNGFTLVELIIVITILVILGSIAFVNYQGYSKNARDSNRLETISSIQKGISLHEIKAGETLLPDDYTEVSASGYLMGYEGIIGENVSRGISLNTIPKDPKTGENYIYYTNKDKNQTQIMGFLEGEELVYFGFSKAQASSIGTKIPRVVGDKLGILLDQNYNRVTGTGIDILGDNSEDIYKIYFSNDYTITSSGSDLFSKIYNSRIDLLNDSSLASFDDSLVGYWDMESSTGGKLKDLSKYGNDGTLIGGITVGGIDGIKGKATYFDGMDDSIRLFNGNSENRTFVIAFNTSFKDLSGKNSYGLLECMSGLSADNYQGYRLLIKNNKQLDFQMSFYNPNGSSTLSSKSISSDIWNILIVKYERKNNNSILMTIFNNGVLLEQKEFAFNGATYAHNDNIYLGDDTAYGGEDHFSGLIDEVRIYNRALSYQEIQSLYNSIK